MVERDDICPFCGETCGHWAAAVAEIEVQTDAADAAAEAVGAMAEKLSAILAEQDRLRAVVTTALDMLGKPGGPSPALLMGAVSLLRAVLDTTGKMGGRADDPTVSSGADSGEHPRTSRPSTDARRGGTWEAAGLIDLADRTLVGDESSAGGAT